MNDTNTTHRSGNGNDPYRNYLPKLNNKEQRLACDDGALFLLGIGFKPPQSKSVAAETGGSAGFPPVLAVPAVAPEHEKESMLGSDDDDDGEVSNCLSGLSSSTNDGIRSSSNSRASGRKSTPSETKLTNQIIAIEAQKYELDVKRMAKEDKWRQDMLRSSASSSPQKQQSHHTGSNSRASPEDQYKHWLLDRFETAETARKRAQEMAALDPAWAKLVAKLDKALG